MAFDYTITPLPAIWPGQRTRTPIPSKFKTQWTRTLEMLEREIRHLRGRQVEFALTLRGDHDVRQDGQLRADARPGAPVIVSFIDGDGHRQAYPCDRFKWWQDNLYAIAVVLEDLRRAERYGVQSALIRAGFKALPAPGNTTTTMTTDIASSVIASFSSHDALRIRTDAAVAQLAVRQAISRTHPDANNGDRKYFDEVMTAKGVLQKHHGGSL